MSDPAFERGEPTAFTERRAIDEVLSILAEESAEVVQRVTKIQRFDFTRNPWTGTHNRDALLAEAGDFLAALALLVRYDVLTEDELTEAANAKLDAFRKRDGRLRHANADGLSLALLVEVVDEDGTLR